MRHQTARRIPTLEQQRPSSLTRSANTALLQAIGRGLSLRHLDARSRGRALGALQRTAGNAAAAALVQRDWDDYLPVAATKKAEGGLNKVVDWLEINVREARGRSAEQTKDIPVMGALTQGATELNSFTIDFGLAALIAGSGSAEEGKRTVVEPVDAPDLASGETRAATAPGSRVSAMADDPSGLDTVHHAGRVPKVSSSPVRHRQSSSTGASPMGVPPSELSMPARVDPNQTTRQLTPEQIEELLEKR